MRIVPSPRSSLEHAALRYAQQGFRVLPCHPRSKVAAISNWPERATTNRTTIARWWSREPESNIALLTGAPGPDVLDIDVRGDVDGRAFLNRLRRDGALDGALLRVSTPSGGEHWYFPGTERRKSKPAAGVDFQARGAYVLAPPSVIEVDGRLVPYRIETTFSGEGSALVLPRTDVSWRPRRSRAWSGPSSRAPDRWLSQAGPHERNDRLFRAACWVTRNGGDPWRLRDIAVQLGLDPTEVRRTIQSAADSTGRRV